ncbi:unnamed protein product [Rhizoctonia solani]|uniref:lytic cellulose monooxygenase (C4-dehydrogenating) n=1 Tax=Rhizoctonia solani TaxID=456999 RepID=A0A8H3DM22_9AGAM|nr:unnamed protein product [Rhizoctonia solani]
MGVRWAGDGGPDKKQWPHPEGPAIVYMASCEGECSKFNPSNAKFFKIAEEGLDGSKKGNSAGNDHDPWGQGLWAQNRIQYENSYHYFNIPSDIKSGQYLVRHELISLHGAHSTSEGAQYYPVCIQIEVTGGGNATPATTPATQLYKTEDGIVNIYEPFDKHGISASTYKIPGPALYVPGKASTPAEPSTTKAASSSVAPATTSVRTTSVAQTGGSGNGNTPTSTKIVTSTTAAPASTGKCKPKKRSVNKRLADESRAVYDRALAHAQAAHAHAKKHASH